jgi:hypothetical protein
MTKIFPCTQISAKKSVMSVMSVMFAFVATKNDQSDMTVLFFKNLKVS